jgi:hypothetical protein
MTASRTTDRLKVRSKATILEPDPPALEHAVRIVHQVCCFAGSFELLDEFRDDALCAAVDRHDTAALFDRLVHDFSFQGISYRLQTGLDWPAGWTP